VQKETEDTGSVYVQYGREADVMTVGGIVKLIMSEGDAKAETEMILSEC